MPSRELAPVERPQAALARITQVDLMAAFLAGRNKRTLRAYAGDLLDFAKFLSQPTAKAAVELLVSLPPGSANAAALGYKAHLAARKLKAATIARRLAALRSMVKLARTLGHITWALDVESPKAQPYRDTRGPGVEGWRAMLVAVQAGPDTPKARRDAAMLWLLYGRGLRRGELVALDLADVDLSPEAPSVAIVGKGQTQKEPLTIAEPCRAALARWVEVRGHHSGPLFGPLDPGADPHGRLTGDGVALIVRALGRRAGLKARVRPHGLRHASITQALDLGRDVRDVAKFSRHRNIQTVLIYDDRRKDVGGDIARQLAGG